MSGCEFTVQDEVPWRR